ncbi:MAG: hypothetical protein JWO62_6 [Acidimicrobiaceae bacterium]|nr:hypothetical protein [Acidimicrobiaceae bacterium]
MAAYFIYGRSEITDNTKSLRYGELVTPQIRRFGGEIAVARGNVHALEGDWEPMAVTILRFESREALMAWYDSPEYAPLKQMRLESNIGDVIVVDGGH